MDISMTPIQARIIGCLIEKEASTPEHYPLSLNALTNACNQKSNREPVMNLGETDVQQALDELSKLHLISEKSGFGSRVVKYQHRFFNSEFSGTRFNPQQHAIVCELLLRGPQTPGELRSRSNRLCTFRDVAEVEQVLNTLIHHDEGPFVAQLPREPGRREARYAQLFCSTATTATLMSAAVAMENQDTPLAVRVDQLERIVAELQQALNDLKQKDDA